MNIELSGVWGHMQGLGLAALAHANRHSAYFHPYNPMWAELSVLQAAHAAEILIKARIAQEHPLLIFDELPKISKQQSKGRVNLKKLFEEGRTVQWSDLNTRLWATTGTEIPNKDIFDRYGKLRNGIQHFSPPPPDVDISRRTLEFVFSVIDPFINKNWGLFAIDFEEDHASYENFPCTLIRCEIPFLVSLESAKYYETWEEDLERVSEGYANIMRKRIEKVLDLP